MEIHKYVFYYFFKLAQKHLLITSLHVATLYFKHMNIKCIWKLGYKQLWFNLFFSKDIKYKMNMILFLFQFIIMFFNFDFGMLFGILHLI